MRVLVDGVNQRGLFSNPVGSISTVISNTTIRVVTFVRSVARYSSFQTCVEFFAHRPSHAAHASHSNYHANTGHSRARINWTTIVPSSCGKHVHDRPRRLDRFLQRTTRLFAEVCQRQRRLAHSTARFRGFLVPTRFPSVRRSNDQNGKVIRSRFARRPPRGMFLSTSRPAHYLRRFKLFCFRPGGLTCQKRQVRQYTYFFMGALTRSKVLRRTYMFF